MVNVSKQPLESEIYKQIFKQFATLTGKSTQQNATSFLQSLLTNSEQIMLAKRLSAIVMLDEGYSPYRIAQTLKLSSTTVGDMFERYQKNYYSGTLLVIGKSKAEREKMWQVIELLLRAGMPSRGKDRWKFLDKHSS